MRIILGTCKPLSVAGWDQGQFRALHRCPAILGLSYPGQAEHGGISMRESGQSSVARCRSARALFCGHASNSGATCVPAADPALHIGVATGDLHLYRLRKSLQDRQVQFRWGLLCAGFRRKVWWWELSVVIRKVSIILVGGVFKPISNLTCRCTSLSFLLP